MPTNMPFYANTLADQFQFTSFNNNTNQDNDRALLIWQITAQQDAALLAEETAFVNALRKADINYPNYSKLS